MGSAEDRDGATVGDHRTSNEYAGSAPVRTVLQVAGDVHGGINFLPQRTREIPRQIGAPPVGFVNRDDVLSWVADRLGDSTGPPPIVVLSGLPGIGKRTLVRRFAHDYKDRFPGGSLRADCAEYRTEQAGGLVDVSGMLARCLRGLGVGDAPMPPTREERRDLFLTRTADRPVLMVVENATEPAQVSALVPNSPGSLVLVTTTMDLTELRFEGAAFRELKPLSDDSSAELFASVAGSLPAGSRTRPDLVAFCAGLPIAILVLAARAAKSHEETLDELADELADERRRLGAFSLGGRKIVSAAFTVAYERLPREAQHLYRRLGLFPGTDVSVDAAGVVASIDPAAARRLLGTLADAHLLERKPGGTFVFHELVRAHARELAAEEPAEHREATIQQVVCCYLRKAAFADRAIMGDRSRVTDHAVLFAERTDPFPGPRGADEAMAWLENERANLPAILAAAFDAGLFTESWQLAEALLAFYFNHRHYADWTAVCDLGARAAHLAGNAEAEARLRIAVSRAYTDLDRLAEAGTELDEAQRLAEPRDDPRLLASVWEFKGRVLDKTDKEAALLAYERSRELNTQAGEPRGIALTLLFQGRTLDALDRHDEALDMLRSALTRFQSEEVRDDRMAARARIALGSVLMNLRRSDEATALLEEAVTALEGKHYEANARELLAQLAAQAGDEDAATRHLRRAVEIYLAEGNPRADRLIAGENA